MLHEPIEEVQLARFSLLCITQLLKQLVYPLPFKL